MPKPGTPNTLLPGLGGTPPAQTAMNNAFSNLGTKATGAVGTGIVQGLNANTKPFNPATQGNALASISTQGINWGAINLNNPPKNTTGLAGNINPSIATPQFNASSNGTPLYDNQGNSVVPSGAPSPITGNATTPSGAVVNAGTGQTVSQPPQAQSTFGGLVGAAANAAQQNSSIGQNAANIASNYGQQIAQVGQQAAMGEAGQRTTGTTPVAEGNASVTQQTAAARQSALASGESAALQGTQQQLTAQQQEQQGLLGAGGLAQPSGTYPFVFNPTTGTFTNSGGGQVTPQQAAQAVNSGQMSPDQAQQALSYLGSSSQSQLYSAMSGINPSFNWNQAAENATIQGTIGPQSSLASSVLNNLQQTLASVPSWQNTGNQTINSLGKLLSNSGITGSGAQQSSQALTDSINESRTAVSNALGTAYNTTPTAFTGMVDAWFPDNPTQAQVQAGVNEFNALMSARSQAFSSPGTVPLPTGGASGATNYNY